jgi:molecular chaperone GrpE
MKEEQDKNKQEQESVVPKEVQEELDLACRERDEYLDGWKRAKADLINFKKEAEQDSAARAERAVKKTILSFLPLADALDEAEKTKTDGLENIKKLVADIFKKEGVVEIKAVLGDMFNPEVHEAVGGEGEVIDQVLQKGYMYKDSVLRAVKVMVKNPKSNPYSLPE